MTTKKQFMAELRRREQDLDDISSHLFTYLNSDEYKELVPRISFQRAQLEEANFEMASAKNALKQSRELLERASPSPK